MRLDKYFIVRRQGIPLMKHMKKLSLKTQYSSINKLQDKSSSCLSP